MNELIWFKIEVSQNSIIISSQEADGNPVIRSQDYKIIEARGCDVKKNVKTLKRLKDFSKALFVRYFRIFSYKYKKTIRNDWWIKSTDACLIHSHLGVQFDTSLLQCQSNADN